MTRFFATALIFFLLSPVLTAQEDEEKATVMLFGSYMTPLGEYGSKIGSNAGVTRRFGFNIGEEAGLAVPGVGLGLEFRTPVLAKGLEWAVSLQCLTNLVSTSEVTDFFRKELDDTVQVELESGAWFHIPLFTGFTYGLDLGASVKVHATLQAGVNITRQAPRSVKADGVTVEETSFKFMPDFGYLAGVGIRLFEDYELLIRYVDLGTPQYQGTRVLNEHFFTTIPRRENDISGDSRPVKMVVLSLGYIL